MHGLIYNNIPNALWINIVHNFPVINSQSRCKKKKITSNIQDICNECEINAKWLAINLQSFGAIKQKMRITSLIKQKVCLASAPEDTPKLSPCRPTEYGLLPLFQFLLFVCFGHVQYGLFISVSARVRCVDG